MSSTATLALALPFAARAAPGRVEACGGRTYQAACQVTASYGLSCRPPRPPQDRQPLALGLKLVTGFWMTLVLERISLNTAPWVEKGRAAARAWIRVKQGREPETGSTTHGMAGRPKSLRGRRSSRPAHLDGLALLAIVPDVLSALCLGVHAHNDHTGLQCWGPTSTNGSARAAAAAAPAVEGCCPARYGPLGAVWRQWQSPPSPAGLAGRTTAATPPTGG